MKKLLQDLHTLALAPMEECPSGLEQQWLRVVLQAMTHTYRLQGQPHSDIDEVHLATLFDGLAEQWMRLRDIAVHRSVPLHPALRTAVSVEEFRALFCEADALNILDDLTGVEAKTSDSWICSLE